MGLSPAEFLYYCVIFTLPFEELYTISGLSITKLIGLLFLIASFTEWRTFYGKAPRALVVLLGFIGIGLIVDAVTYAAADLYAINQFSRLILVWWLMLATYNLALHNRFDRLVKVMYAASLLFAFFQSLRLGGASLRVYEGAIGGEEGMRFSVLGMDPNFAAAYVALCVLFGLAHGLNIIKTRLSYRVFFLIGAGVGFYAMLRTGSRGGLLALGGGVLSLVFTARQWNRRATSMFVVAGIILAMGVAVSNDPYLAARFRASAEAGHTSGRFEIWKRALQLSTESPVYGFGSTMHMPKLGQRTGSKQRGTHNLFLSVLLGSGMTGLLFFLCFYVRAFKAVWACKAEGMGRIVFAWFVLAFLAAWSLNMESMKWFWIILALSLVAEKVYSSGRTCLYPERSTHRTLAFLRVPAVTFSMRRS
jgi:O-antigen ligase